jgi:hypothetical protein
MQALAEKYAKLKGTILLASAIKEDGSITFVLASGPKLSMTEKELKKAIAQLEQANKTENPALSMKTMDKIEAKTKKEK